MPIESEPVFLALGAVLAEYREKQSAVEVSTGPWYDGNRKDR
jgi:hypothetical protein